MVVTLPVVATKVKLVHLAFDLGHLFQSRD
jgi:hypothetical protein